MRHQGAVFAVGHCAARPRRCPAQARKRHIPPAHGGRDRTAGCPGPFDTGWRRRARGSDHRATQTPTPPQPHEAAESRGLRRPVTRQARGLGRQSRLGIADRGALDLDGMAAARHRPARRSLRRFRPTATFSSRSGTNLRFGTVTRPPRGCARPASRDARPISPGHGLRKLTNLLIQRPQTVPKRKSVPSCDEKVATEPSGGHEVALATGAPTTAQGTDGTSPPACAPHAVPSVSRRPARPPPRAAGPGQAGPRREGADDVARS